MSGQTLNPPRPELGETKAQLVFASQWVGGAWRSAIDQHGPGAGANKVSAEPIDGGSAGGAPFDPTADSPWRVHAWAACDTFVVAVSAVWMIPKCLVLVPLLLGFLLPPLLAVQLHSHVAVPAGSTAVDRTLAFHLAHAVALLLALPATAVVIASVWADFLVIAVFGFLWALATCRLHRVAAGYRVADPFRGGPPVWLRTADIFVAMVGQIHRQGFMEAWAKFTVMWLTQPWLKYWIGANPWVSDLGIRFITQISTRMDDMQLDAVKNACVRWLSHTKLEKQEVKEKDFMFFSPHYAYPPPGHHMALGMQLGGTSTLLVHATHLYQADDPLVLSSSVIVPMYRVMLWWNNPFHLYCGFVEACISSGLPSQPDKPNSGEHPMWLVCGHNYLAAHRNSPAFGPGYVDMFFDRFLPNFVHYIRSRIRGKEIADEMWQDVISKVGVSRPEPRMGGSPQQQAAHLKKEGFA